MSELDNLFTYVIQDYNRIYIGCVKAQSLNDAYYQIYLYDLHIHEILENSVLYDNLSLYDPDTGMCSALNPELHDKSEIINALKDTRELIVTKVTDVLINK